MQYHVNDLQIISQKKNSRTKKTVSVDADEILPNPNREMDVVARTVEEALQHFEQIGPKLMSFREFEAEMMEEVVILCFAHGDTATTRYSVCLCVCGSLRHFTC